MMRLRHFGVGFLLGAVALLGAQGRTAQAALLGVTFENQLISIDTTSGAGTLVGTFTAPSAFPFGLAYRGNDLYTFDQGADRLLQLDPTSGAILNTIDIGVGDISGEGALAFRSDGVGFLSSSARASGQLFRFQVSPPSSTPITSSTGFTPSMDGLAFDSADVLYALSQSSSPSGNTSLYTVDTTTGLTTLVGSLGLSTNFLLGGLAFDTDGTLYAVLSEDRGHPSFLYRVNKSTGAATLVGNIGFTGVSGVTGQPGSVPPIPEPSSLVLAGLGVAGLVGARVRRARRRG